MVAQEAMVVLPPVRLEQTGALLAFLAVVEALQIQVCSAARALLARLRVMRLAALAAMLFVAALLVALVAVRATMSMAQAARAEFPATAHQLQAGQPASLAVMAILDSPILALVAAVVDRTRPLRATVALGVFLAVAAGVVALLQMAGQQAMAAQEPEVKSG